MASQMPAEVWDTLFDVQGELIQVISRMVTYSAVSAPVDIEDMEGLVRQLRLAALRIHGAAMQIERHTVAPYQRLEARR